MATIAGVLAATAQRCPDRIALICGDRHYTYRELDQAVNQTAHALAAAGVAKGDRLVLMSHNDDGYVVAAYAALRLGALIVPVNPGSPVPELQYLLADSGATMLVFGAGVAKTVIALAETEAPTAKLLALGTVEGYEDLFDSAATQSWEAPEIHIDETDDALILYTSGTTGRPKGALFDHHRTIWVGIGAGFMLGYRDGDRILHVAPMYHAAELALMLFGGTLVGATHVVLAKFEPEHILDVMEQHRIQVFFGVPTMYQLLLRSDTLPKRDLSAWRVGLFGAAPMPAFAVAAAVASLPGVELIQACGQTEGGPGGIFCTAEEVRARPDASGRGAFFNNEVRIVNPDGNDIALGETGELIMRGETMMKGYWRNPEATAATVRDGWVHTGDIATIDADGYITLVDRIKDMIISGGRNVYSVEVEGALAAHPDIAEIAIISRKHPEFGETVIAVVTLLAGRSMTLDELRAFGAERLSSYKLPRELIIRDIPRNPSGKILKHVLRAEIEKGQS